MGPLEDYESMVTPSHRLKGKKTFSYRVCIKGIGNINSNDNNFYGISKEVIQIKYPRRLVKEVVLVFL